MLRGLSTVRYHTNDLVAAKRWYTELLGVEPCVETPAYVEFRVGDYQHELGLFDRRYAPELGHGDRWSKETAGEVTYWHVDDVPVTMERLISLGATELEAPKDFGEGYVGASVLDPFGNVLGIMYNPHYLDVLETAQGA